MSSNTSSSSQTNAAPSPLDADIVLVDGRKFRKQSVQMSPESSKDKKEAKANALTFSQDDGGWRNDAELRVREEDGKDK